MAAQRSRIEKAGGDVEAARRQLESEIASGTANLSGAQQALYQRDPEAFFGKFLGQRTKGKFSGPLGGIAKTVSKVAPFALPLIPGLGPIAAGVASAGIGKLSGQSLKSALLQGAGTAAGSALVKKAGGLSSLARKATPFLGKTLKSTFTTPEGGLDLSRVAGAAGAVAGLAGRQSERKAAQRTIGGQNDLRNLLIRRLLESPQYNFQPTESS